MAQATIHPSQVRETQTATRVATYNLRQMLRGKYTTNELAKQLIQRAKLYADHADSQHAEIDEMLSIADSYEAAEKAVLLWQALWTAEVSLSMVNAGVAMLQAAALEISVDYKKAEGMQPRQ